MADPTSVTCTAGAWTKVATSVTTGRVYVGDSGKNYARTYNATGTGVPADAVATTTAIGLDEGQGGNAITHNANIDIYVWCFGDDDGSVIVEV